MSQTVVSLPGRSVQYTGENLRAGLQHELMLFHHEGGKFKELSKRLGGHPWPGTISRIAYGDTKDPRSTTVILLFYGLGFEIIARKL